MKNGAIANKDSKTKEKKSSRHGKVPPKNPNKRPTIINLERSIGYMKANDREAIRRAAE